MTRSVSLWIRMRSLLGRRRYYLARLWRPKVPARPLAELPDGFAIHHVADTGLAIVDNFCTPDEAAAIIEKARGRVSRSTVVGGKDGSVTHEYRTSRDVHFRLDDGEPALMALANRASMLLGVPANHVETISVTHYVEGEYYKGHFDYGKSFAVDRLYTVLIYLNDLAADQGGGTLFRDLNVIVTPKLGRAVCWTNSDPDGSRHSETWHAALPPVGDGVEKWIVQLWVRAYKFSRPPRSRKLRHIEAGKPLKGEESLPAGASAAGSLDEASLFRTDSV